MYQFSKNKTEFSNIDKMVMMNIELIKNSKTKGSILTAAFCALVLINTVNASDDSPRTMKYTSRAAKNAVEWQNQLRLQLSGILKIDDMMPGRKNIPFDAKEIQVEKKDKYLLREIEINSTKNRRIKIILTIPENIKGRCPAVVCIHGHGGTLRVVYDEKSIYKGFAAELAARNYITIATTVSQHVIYEEGRMLMGERLWDLMRCVDYLESLKEVDKKRIGCAGLSLGGEMAMWLGAMDPRINATLSSGFLTVMDQMEKNHCMCWKFPGLRELVDWADIYSLIAPRALLCQNGLKEPENDFTVPLARKALKEIEVIYEDLKKPGNVRLVAHEGAHEIDLPTLLDFFNTRLSPINR
ncbi:MAG TPA: hypothetical protein DDW27_21290 [Bacteroidales bacterium]|nr:hypothetical protein [Bacteroidales bacterium]